MQKTIKSYIEYGDECGIAMQVNGQTVDAVPHPKFEGLWRFEFDGKLWLASDYAFKE